MVVLDKAHLKTSRLSECFFVVALQEETALVAKHLGLDHQHIGNVGRRDLHASPLPSFSTRSRYFPYPFFFNGSANLSICASSMNPARQAISSVQAIFSPCRFSSVAMNWPASSRLSCVPVS